jgi:NAD(P)H-dependent flavin oxidoreductase YrpB (nitropropane dioxygenase family)
MMGESTTKFERANPWLIQGGMGIAISGWPLARAVAREGQLGVVSGTAIDNVFVRRLQDNGVDETLQAVLDRFPLQSVVSDALARFATTRREPSAPYHVIPMLTQRSAQRSVDLLVLASYVEVALAKEGHDGIVGVNLLTKVQIPTAPALFGAILGGVDYVLMGAGLPTQIPGTIEQLSLGHEVTFAMDIAGDVTAEKAPTLHFDPTRYLPGHDLRRPKFLGIVSGHVLATALAKRSNGPVDGFVVERPSAGGHNAPPRGRFAIDAEGNPEYGERDRVDFEVMSALNVPFWIGGGITSAEDVREALDLGATGVQVGTLFAYCRESGMDPVLRERVIAAVQKGSIEVKTSMRASSTGYPFKVASIEGTIAEPKVYAERERKCDLGYLREAYIKANGTIGYRCAAEPVPAYIRKGGKIEDAQGVTCLCNGLMSTAGLGQVRSDGKEEPPIVTSGDRINEIRALLSERSSFGAVDVIEFLRPGVSGEAASVDGPPQS